MALNAYLLAVVPKGFFPQQDNGLMTGTIQASQGTSFQAMRQILGEYVGRLRRDPAIDTVVAFTGGGTTANQARLFISLKPREERRASADQVIARLRPAFAHDPRGEPVSPGGAGHSSGRAASERAVSVHPAGRRSEVARDVGAAARRPACARSRSSPT